MIDALIRLCFSLLLIFFLFASHIYARQTNRNSIRIIPLFLSLGCTLSAFSVFPKSYLSNFVLLITLTAAAFIGIISGYILAKSPLNQIDFRSKLKQKVEDFLADRRMLVVSSAVMVALIATVPFGYFSTGDLSGGFWKSFYASWVANLVFFALVGLAGIIVTLHRPEKDDFSRRVSYLFGGRQDAAVSYIIEKIRQIGYYAEKVTRTYKIKQFDLTRNAVLIRVEHVTLIKNFYDDLACNDDAYVRITPDQFDPPLEVIGQLLSFRIDNVEKLRSQIMMTSDKEFVHSEKVEIGKGETSTIEVISETWHSLTEEHNFAPNRFAKILQINVIHEAHTPEKLIPLEITLPVASKHRIAYLANFPIPPMIDKAPSETAFRFRVGAPEPEIPGH